MSTDADSTQTSRARLLFAGKTLFSRNGYEQTSTAAIAREAGSSESQLIRYFGGKAGLLEAIFNEAWSALAELIQQEISQAAHGREAILRILGLMIDVFTKDGEIAFLFLFEGRRVRGATHDVVLSRGYMQFIQVTLQLIQTGQQDGSFRADVPAPVLASAMTGCAEGMIRERLIALKAGGPGPFEDSVIRTTFEAMVNGLAPA